NTINFNHLKNYTYLIMIIFMFIGGASGSTAGGIKVNSLGIIYAYIKSIIKGEKKTILMKKSISSRLINNTFLIIILYLIFIFFGTLFLSIIENKDFIKILFEVVSAIGTVGLSAGLTFDLSSYSKLIIIFLMFFGRIGPMTILNAVSYKSLSYEISYPEEIISIG
ncbi:MAG: TrkH family potassium uptake protein, partial [Spirochaetes bacterium]|nr:TrkH family potassium uptake protein [Spirochaetota bacterium]